MVRWLATLPRWVYVPGEQAEADHATLAPAKALVPARFEGGVPASHPALSGHEHCIFSNEAFDLKELPKAVMIEGGGYIAVEFANIFHGLGVETTLVYRGQEILSRFDMDLRRALQEHLKDV